MSCSVTKTEITPTNKKFKQTLLSFNVSPKSCDIKKRKLSDNYLSDSEKSSKLIRLEDNPVNETSGQFKQVDLTSSNKIELVTETENCEKESNNFVGSEVVKDSIENNDKISENSIEIDKNKETDEKLTDDEKTNINQTLNIDKDDVLNENEKLCNEELDDSFEEKNDDYKIDSSTMKSTDSSEDDKKDYSSPLTGSLETIDLETLQSSEDKNDDNKSTSKKEKENTDSKKPLTPKRVDQLKKREEKLKQREQIKQEKERKLQEAKEEKKRQKIEKDEQRRKEKEERERKRLLEIEQKNEEKRQKEEERKQKEEEKKRKDEEKRQQEEEKKRKRELEKEQAELKKKRTSQAFLNFFQKEAKDENKRDDKSVFEDQNDLKINNIKFMPFQVKKDMRIAPIIRVNSWTQDRLNFFENSLSSQDTNENQLYLTNLKNKDYKIGRDKKTWPISEKDEDSSEDIIIIEDNDTSIIGKVVETGHEINTKAKHKIKLLQFHENRRPPYWGTWRKKSPVITPRRPYATDKKIFDYSIDSDDEWEEEEPGESLHGSDDEKESQDENYEVDNDFFVPHGYLSEEEIEENAEDGISAENYKERLKLKEQEFEAEIKRKTEKIKPRIIGCIWVQQNKSNAEDKEIEKPEKISESIWRFLSLRKMLVSSNTIDLTTVYDNLTDCTLQQQTNNSTFANLFPEIYMNSFIKLVHGNINSKVFLYKEFVAYLNKIDPDIQVSKRSFNRFLRNVAQWTLCSEDGPMNGKICWTINKDILEKYNSDATIVNKWEYILQPKRVANIPIETAEEPEQALNKFPPIAKLNEKIDQKADAKQMKINDIRLYNKPVSKEQTVLNLFKQSKQNQTDANSKLESTNSKTNDKVKKRVQLITLAKKSSAANLVEQIKKTDLLDTVNISIDLTIEDSSNDNEQQQQQNEIIDLVDNNSLEKLSVKQSEGVKIKNDEIEIKDLPKISELNSDQLKNTSNEKPKKRVQLITLSNKPTLKPVDTNVEVINMVKTSSVKLDNIKEPDQNQINEIEMKSKKSPGGQKTLLDFLKPKTPPEKLKKPKSAGKSFNEQTNEHFNVTTKPKAKKKVSFSDDVHILKSPVKNQETKSKNDCCEIINVKNLKKIELSKNSQSNELKKEEKPKKRIALITLSPIPSKMPKISNEVDALTKYIENKDKQLKEICDKKRDKINREDNVKKENENSKIDSKKRSSTEIDDKKKNLENLSGADKIDSSGAKIVAGQLNEQQNVENLEKKINEVKENKGKKA